MNPCKLLICGGRDFDDVDFAVDALTRLKVYWEADQRPFTEVITGEADGADSIGMEWAKIVGIPHKGFPVTDSDWKRKGKGAAYARNEAMLNYGPDLVLGFPGGGGTDHMLKISREVPWVEVIHCKRAFFTKEDEHYGFCSNFAEGYDFADADGLWWKTSEHYYQAHRSVDPKEQWEIQNAPDAAEAKRLGNTLSFERSDWKHVKLDVMRKALAYKFAKDTEAADRLLGTGFDYLMEYAPWGDSFWGVNADRVGHNWLGRLLNERKFQL